MKRTIALLLALVMALGMVGCGENKETIQAAVDAIDKIGEVSDNSGTLIATADELYSQLTEAEKEKVTNYNLLEEAKEKYQEIMSINAAKEAYKEITEAANLTNSGLADNYSAWNWGINGDIDFYYDIAKDDAKQKGEDYLITFMAGLIRRELPNIGVAEWDEFTEGLKELGWTGKEFVDEWSNCVHFVVYMYEKLGLVDELDSRLESASTIINDLDPSSAYYNDLKDYLAAVKKRAEFIKSPSGSLTQLSSTISEFREELAESQAKLDIYLGE